MAEDSINSVENNDLTITNDVNDDEEVDESRRKLSAKLSSSSFQSATSFTSFRSCRSIKSFSSRASSKLFLSRGNSYTSQSFYSCADEEDINSQRKYGLVNEAYQDNASFHSFNDSINTPKSSIISSERLRSVSDSILLGFKTDGVDDESSSSDGSHKKYSAKTFQRFSSYLAVIAAGAFIASSSHLSHLSPKLPGWLLLLYRSLSQLILSVVFMMVLRVNPLGTPGVRLRLFISALLNCFLVLCLHQSLTRLTPELCSTLLLMSPVLTNLVTSVMGGEHMGMFRVVILSGYIAGVFLLTQLPDHHGLTALNVYGYPTHFRLAKDTWLDPVGVVCAVLATILSALILNFNRYCKSVSFSVILFWSSLGATLLSAICLFVCRDNLQDDDQFFITREGREIPEHLEILNNSDVPKDTIDTFSIPHRLFEGSTEWVVASIISALGIIATIIMIKALQYIPAGRAALLQSSMILTDYILISVLEKTALRMLDMVGVVFVIFTILASFSEEMIVDTRRWKWF